ncbi:MAG: hypothetical protein ACM3O4_01185 [Ignavibacteriales bacterium]
MKERHTETYIFRDGDIAKKKLGNTLSNESYYKQDVLGAVEQAIISEQLKKAVKVDNPRRYSSNIYYVFKMADEESKTTFRVGVPRKSYDENDPYIRSLNSLKVAGSNIKIANRTKLAATIGAVIMAGTLFGAAFMSGLEKEWEYQDAKQQQYFEEINQGRAENGMPPLNIVDENGNPYNSWQQYYEDQKALEEQEKGKGR